MPTVYDVPAEILIKKIAEKFEENPDIQAPEWSRYAKTGVHKELSPIQENWWYIRAASILRKIYLRGPIGVSRLRVMYGGKKRRGVKPVHFAKGSGAVIRTILQQLEKANYVEKKEISRKKTKVVVGRVISQEGQSLVDKIATEIARDIPQLEKYIAD